MKEIVSESSDRVSWSNLPQHPIIGLKNSRGDDKAWLQPDGYYSGTYTALAVNNGVHHGNSYQRGLTLQDMRDKLSKSFDFFLFDSERELFAWLAK